MPGAENANQPPRKERNLAEEQIARLRESDRQAKRAARARETPEKTENRWRAKRGNESSTRPENS